MDQRVLVGGIIIILLVLFASGCTNTPSNNTTSSSNSTKISLTNNGTAWIQAAVMFENATSANGTGITTPNGQKTLYAYLIKQPQGQPLVMDISKQLNTTAFPPGTVLRMKMWADLLKPNVTTTDTLSFSLYGYETAQQGNAIPFVFVKQNIPDVYQLPGNVTQDTVEFTTDPAQGANFIQRINSYYMEFVITVNPDGTVTITQLPTPELCSITG
jgi:hypothetical protein